MIKKFFTTALTALLTVAIPVQAAVAPVTDTARKATYLSNLEKEIVLELNRARVNPQWYARERIAKIRGYYKGNIIKIPGKAALMQTQEGVRAVDECYRALLNTRAMGPLSPSAGLSRAARDLVKDQQNSRRTGHTGSDGSSPFSRMNRYGRWQATAAENIGYGWDNAQWIVLMLLIDDGVPDRGHRINILNPALKKVGVAFGKHGYYRYMAVMDFAGGYAEKS